MASKQPIESASVATSESSKLIESVAHVERERLQFRELLLSNPNYFGTLKASSLAFVTQVTNKQRYESLGCVGFQPQQQMLEAVVRCTLQLVTASAVTR